MLGGSVILRGHAAQAPAAYPPYRVLCHGAAAMYNARLQTGYGSIELAEFGDVAEAPILGRCSPEEVQRYPGCEAA